MTRAGWLSILSQTSREGIEPLARLAEARFAVDITRAPAQALLLATVEESVEGRAFHPGEILVTTCEARIGDRLGSAVILGGDADKARMCAVLDAALQGEFPEREQVLAALAEEARALAAARHAEQEMVGATRVRFETMDPQR